MNIKRDTQVIIIELYYLIQNINVNGLMLFFLQEKQSSNVVSCNKKCMCIRRKIGERLREPRQFLSLISIISRHYANNVYLI